MAKNPSGKLLVLALTTFEFAKFSNDLARRQINRYFELLEVNVVEEFA